MRRKKSLTISQTKHRTPPISIPITTKEKQWEREKKGKPRQEQKREQKTGAKLKESRLVKLS